MTTHPLHPVRSEKGVALIIVLLLLTVMMGLTTGLTLNGQTEIAMASNEVHYAGARAAAEAGMNRAIEHITSNTGADLLADGAVPVIGNGPFDLGTDYSYSFEIVDDDDSTLYAAALSADQLTAMIEDGDPDTDTNDRLILRVTGLGPKGTVTRISRVLQSVETPNMTTTSTDVITNPAILVNGDLDISGNIKVLGSRGNVHSNGDIIGGGSETITGDITATGDVDDALDPAGLKAGGMPPITVPEVKASDYLLISDWILKANGTKVKRSTGAVCTSGCPTGWTYTSATKTWSSSGSMPQAPGGVPATYYVEGNVQMHGTGGSGFTEISVVAEGNIKLTGNGKFKPGNTAKVQFVSNGDFELGGTVDADDSVNMDGLIMVREQMKIYGNSEFQGRVVVENRDHLAWDAANPNGSRGSSTTATNNLSGNMKVTYNGSLGDIVTTITTDVTLPSTYTNNFSGWIEQ